MPVTRRETEDAGTVARQSRGTPTESRTIRVRPAAYAWLTEEARTRGESMPDVVDRLIRDLERWRFAAAAQAGYARLRHDPAGWADYRAEVAALDGTVADGLEEFPWGGE